MDLLLSQFQLFLLNWLSLLRTSFMSANLFYSLLTKFTSVGKASIGEAIKSLFIMFMGKVPVACKEIRILEIHLKQASTTYNWNEVVMMNDSNFILSLTNHSIDSMRLYFQHCLQLMIAEGDLVLFLKSQKKFILTNGTLFAIAMSINSNYFGTLNTKSVVFGCPVATPKECKLCNTPTKSVKPTTAMTASTSINPLTPKAAKKIGSTNCPLSLWK